MTSRTELGLPHDPILHGDIILSPEWFRHPRLIMNPTIFPVGDHDHQSITDIQVLKNSIQTQFSHEFEQNKCSVSLWNGNGVENPTGSLVAIQPVLLGELPFRVREAFIHPNPTYFANTLREDLPELHDPLVQTVGSKQMRLDPSIHPNFVNLIFIEDSDGLLRMLPSERKIIFARFLMAKLGAFKNILVPYERDGETLRADSLILTTLEGGAPDAYICRGCEAPLGVRIGKGSRRIYR